MKNLNYVTVLLLLLACTLTAHAQIGIKGEKNPLYFVNGIAVSSIDNVTPEDIQSIDVLKDKSAEMFGPEGADGVVIITLKDGAAVPFAVPVFRDGGLDEFAMAISGQLPKTKGLSSKQYRGSAWVLFTVDSEGKVTEARVMQSSDEELTPRIRRLLETAPYWTPAQKDGEKIPVMMFTDINYDFTVASQRVVPTPVAANASATSPAAVKKAAPEEPKGEIFIITEEMPKFNGGNLASFRTWVTDNAAKQAYMDEKQLSGRVMVSFVVEKDGSVSNVEAINKPNEILAGVAVAAVKKSPKWTPGKQKGEAVRVRFTIPVEVDVKKAKGTPPASEQAAGSDKSDVFIVVEQMPKFKGGGILEFRRWVAENLVYPKEALQNKITGRVILSFIIEKDGRIGSCEILEAPDVSLGREGQRVVLMSPKWTPGIQRGEPVRVTYTLPIEFRLSGSGNKNTPRSTLPTRAPGNSNPGMGGSSYRY